LVLPFMPETYQDIAKTWGFPSLVLCSIRQPYAFNAYFNPVIETCKSPCHLPHTKI